MIKRMIEDDSIVCWSSAPVATEVNGEIVLMNMDRDCCYALGTTGSEVWRKIATPIHVHELCRQLNLEYSAPLETILFDVRGMLTGLLKEKLIEILPSASGELLQSDSEDFTD
jgi:hypothetical protein